MADSNMQIWDALAKTDPTHTKPFNRSGGFKGTAIKPIYIIRKLTEQFGACGVGWGIGEPSFQVVPCDGETLVFCTVSCWHGKPENLLHGVGGDKVQAKRSSGPFCDDEAFKKAFTDAVNNAFKFIGVGADVHMGLFDDDKYVTAAKEEFNPTPNPAPKRKPDRITDEQRTELMALTEAANVLPIVICETYNVPDFRDLTPSQFEAARKRLNLTIDRAVAEKESA